MARLKDGGGRAVAVFAGAETSRTLLPYVDEIRLVVYPVLLGSGLALFGERRQPLSLVGAREFPASGVVQLRYRRGS
ncbi:dihydrofolate reductase family protein [Mycolicibacterium gilvum]